MERSTTARFGGVLPRELGLALALGSAGLDPRKAGAELARLKAASPLLPARPVGRR